jgi:hypothetical protein
MKKHVITVVLTAVHLHLATAGPPGICDKSGATSARPVPREDYVAHEWGTFTSVQGSDGIQLEWNPLTTTELPGFVYDFYRRDADKRGGPVVFGQFKSQFSTLQRMETPVIYFYSDKERTVDVAVDFPEGIVTEWYPQLNPLPRFTDAKGGIVKNRSIRWDDVRVLPRREHAALTAQLPADSSGSHYFAARGANADFLRVNPGGDAKKTPEIESFLFYRGVGNFKAPLTVTLGGADSEVVTLHNAGREELRHFYVYAVRDGRAKFARVKALAPGATNQIKFDTATDTLPLAEARKRIAAAMTKSLAQEGLYEAEAVAMVRTWDESWFTEPGLRVFYVLPQTWTDRVLPLALNPAPRETIRVMVGRAELITPSAEWELMKQIVHYLEGDASARARAVEGIRGLGLGRFLEPATRRLLAKLPNREFNQKSHELLQAVAKPAPAGKPLAAN